MNLFEFLSEHPWWSFVYLIVLVIGLEETFGDWFRKP